MHVDQLLQRVSDHLAVGRAFGPSYERDGTMVIPVALVAGGGGGGGDGRQPDEASGGGFGGVVHPIGAYVVREGDVRFVPAVNVTAVATAGLLLLRVLAKRRRRPRACAGPRRAPKAT